MFYSPMQCQSHSVSKDCDEEDKNENQAVEILPQYSKNRLGAANEKRRSEVSKFAQEANFEESLPDVSHIEHVKRDDILDDSLLFAL